MMTIFQFRDPSLTIHHTFDENPVPYHMHTHTFAELYCFLSGKGIFHVEGNSYPLSPGDIMLMRPTEAHFIELDPNVPYERICLNFDIRLFDALDPDNQLMQPYFDRKAGSRNHYPADDTATAYLRAMLRPDGTRATVIANLTLLMQHLCGVFGSAASTARQPDSVEYRMIRYINQNLHAQLSVQELCDRFFLSRAQLCRRFQAATGTSVGRYITVKRLFLARQLIHHGQKPTDIFSACGYNDYTTFYRAYKAYFGCSPKEELPAWHGSDHATIE